MHTILEKLTKKFGEAASWNLKTPAPATVSGPRPRPRVDHVFFLPSEFSFLPTKMHFLPRPPPFLPRPPLFLPTNFLGARVLYSETITTIRTLFSLCHVCSNSLLYFLPRNQREYLSPSDWHRRGNILCGGVCNYAHDSNRDRRLQTNNSTFHRSK